MDVRLFTESDESWMLDCLLRVFDESWMSHG
jgi:hypothetical protein